MSNSYDLKFRTKTIKVAAYLEVIGFDIEVEPDAINASGEVLLTTEPADRAELAVAGYHNGATVPAQALLDGYTALLHRARAVRQTIGSKPVVA
jgi:hypothetical protein